MLKFVCKILQRNFPNFISQERDHSSAKFAAKVSGKRRLSAATRSSTPPRSLTSATPAARPSTAARRWTRTWGSTWGTGPTSASFAARASTRRATTRIIGSRTPVRRRSGATFATKRFTRWLGERWVSKILTWLLRRKCWWTIFNGIT